MLEKIPPPPKKIPYKYAPDRDTLCLEKDQEDLNIGNSYEQLQEINQKLKNVRSKNVNSKCEEKNPNDRTAKKSTGIKKIPKF